MQRTLKTLATFVATALMAVMLAGCGNDTVTKADLETYTRLAAAAEAAKGDAKLDAAHKETAELAKIAVARGDYTNPKNCDVDPDGLFQTKAAKDYPYNVSSFYRAACMQAVEANVGAHKKADATAVANNKAKERKLAAKKAKAEALAAKKAAEAKRLADAKAKHKPVSRNNG